MLKIIQIIYIVLALLSLPVYAENKNHITSIIMDYPHGNTFLYVFSNGDNFLAYGTTMSSRKYVKDHTFNLDNLYQKLTPWLNENIPREQWPNPKSVAGMVTVSYQDKTEKDFLIFDAEELTDSIFLKAKKNLKPTKTERKHEKF